MSKLPSETIQKYCRRFGAIAVERGYITGDQLEKALIEQVRDDLKRRPHRLIGTILFERDWMTWDQIDSVVKELIS